MRDLIFAEDLSSSAASRKLEKTKHILTSAGGVHVGHCFDYLRQGIKCSGDMSLEWPVVQDVLNGIDGWGIPHVCRSWVSFPLWLVIRSNVWQDDILGFMDANHFNGSTSHHIEADQYA